MYRNEIVYKDGSYVYLDKKKIHKEGFWLGNNQIKFTIENPVKVYKYISDSDDDDLVEEKIEMQAYTGIKPFLVKVTPSKDNETEFLELIFSDCISSCIRFCASHYQCKKIELIDVGIWVLDLKYTGKE